MAIKRVKSLIASVTAVTLAVTAMPTCVMASTSSDGTKNVTIREAVEVDGSSRLDELWKNKEEIDQPLYGDDEMVTVIVELKDAPVMEAYNISTYKDDDETTVGEAVADFLATEEVKEASEELKGNQEEVIEDIKDLVTEDTEVQVNAQWTIVTNAFSVSVPYGKIGEIRKMEDVKRAYVEHTYAKPEPVGNPDLDETKPIHSYSYDMAKVSAAWEKGYTGKGMLVAVLDSGIDIKVNYEGKVVRTHEAFRDDSFLSGNPTDGENDWNLRYTSDSLAAFLEENQLVSTTGAEGNKIVYDNNALYKTLKVPYAADYADGDVNVLPTDSDHGTHVSGTVAGFVKTEEGEVKFSGVAPDAQILFMKVFPDADGGATESSLVNALEDSLKLGADVINLSLGSDNGYAIDDTIQNDTFARVEKSGIVMMTSAGNSSYSAVNNNYNGHNTTANPEISMISAPAIYASNLGVASIDNAIDVQAYLTWTDNEGKVHEVPFSDPWSYAMKSDFSDKETPIYLVDGVGSYDNYNDAGFNSGYNNGKDGIALVKRGEISFVDKINNAMSFSTVNSRGERIGVQAVIIYDSDPNATDLIYMSVENTSLDSCFISGKDGNEIAEALKSGYDVKIKVSKDDKIVQNATAGEMSSYSSWGAGSGLELKPEITAPGGNIWSSVISKANNVSDADYVGSYELMSGTSMSAPHMSGIAALTRQYILESKKFQVENAEMGDLISQLLVSTAVPQVDKKGVFYSPRQQGAGLVNLEAALDTPAYITVDGKNIGKLELLDDPQKKGVYNLKFDVHNISDQELTYDLKVTLMRPDTDVVTSNWGDRNVMLENDVIIEEVSLGTVKIAANSTVTVEKAVALTDSQKAELDKLFENGIYVEGFVRLTNGTNPDLGLPMLAFYGDWTKAPIFDSSLWIDEPEDNENIFNNECTWANNIIGHCIVGTTGIVGYMNLGQNAYDETSTDNQTIYHKENITISPDGNGFFDCVDDAVLYQLRNARLVVVEVTNSETGEVYFREGSSYNIKTTYNQSYGMVIPYSAMGYGIIPIWEGTDLEGNVLPSGTKCTYKITAYGEGDFGEEVYDEEYGAYVTDFDKVISGEVVPTFNGHEMDMTGDVITFPVVIDTKAPELKNNAVSIYEEDGHVYMEGTVYDEDGSLATVQITPYVVRKYKGGYGDPNYSEIGTDYNNPFLSDIIYDAAKKEVHFKVDVTSYEHTNESYAGENSYYDYTWNGNVLLSCGDYGANDRSYAIKVDSTEGIVLSQTSARLHVGSTFNLSVNNNTGSDAVLVRTSSRPEVATVDEFGKIEAISAGQTVIKVSNGVDEAFCVVVVEEYTHEVKNFELSLDRFEGLKPDGSAVVKVVNLEPADVVLDDIRWSVEESDEYAEKYGEGLISVQKNTADALEGELYLNVAASDVELPASIGTLTVTLNGVSKTMEIGWDNIYTTSDQDDIISDLNYNAQVVYTKPGETVELVARYRQDPQHSIGAVVTKLSGLKMDGPDFYSINGFYETKLVNEEGYKLPENIKVYTVYDYGYEYEMIAGYEYGYFYNSVTGVITVKHAPSGATNKLKIVAEGVESAGTPAGTLSGNTYTKPDPLYGPFDWDVTEGEEALTGTLETFEKYDTYKGNYTGAKYTPDQPGVSYITVKSKDKKYSLNFAVVCEPVLADKISVETHSVILDKNETKKLSVEFQTEPTLEEDREIVWKSFDESVATIDEEGVITAKKEGFAYIIASTKADNRVMDYCIVRVTNQIYAEVVMPDGSSTDAKLEVVECDKNSEEYKNVEELVKNTMPDSENTKIFEITLIDSNNSKIEPDGSVSVTIEVPEGMDGERVVVYRVDDTSKTLILCETKFIDGKIVFTTDHFSTYVFVQVASKDDTEQGDDKNPGSDKDNDNNGGQPEENVKEEVTPGKDSSLNNSEQKQENPSITPSKGGDVSNSLAMGIVSIGIIVLGIICCVLGMKKIKKK